MKSSGSPAMGRFRAGMYGFFIVALYTLPIAAIIVITRIVGGDAVTARKVGQRHGKPVIYTVASGKMVKEGFPFYRSVNGVWLTKKVPPRFLTRYAAPDSDHEGR
jgi:hypothetical protein